MFLASRSFLKPKKLLSYLFFGFVFFQNSDISAFDQKKNNETFLTSQNSLNEKSLKSEYLLGPGDSLIINYKGIDLFSNIYNISPDGFLFLPEINEVFVEGQTVKELKETLVRKYKGIIIDPNFDVIINEYRPVTVYIFGEVRNPGLYKLEYDKGNSRASNVGIEIGEPGIGISPTETFLKAPKLYDLLQEANGVTNYADLTKIKVIRKNSISQGGGVIKTDINLLSMILEGDQFQNIRLNDGDSVEILKSENPIKEQVLAISKTNINPEFITVFITGNVINQGPVNLKKGSSLLQAIASSGGKKIMTGSIIFVRFNDDGTSKKKAFRYDESAKINTSKNPILMDGDIINVNKTILGKTAEVIKDVSTPIFGGYGLYKIFN